jgi:cytochrome c peroxidase
MDFRGQFSYHTLYLKHHFELANHHCRQYRDFEEFIPKKIVYYHHEIKYNMKKVILYSFIMLALGCQSKTKNNNTILALILADSITYKWNLPAGFPTPSVPQDNPMTNEKVALGRFLFYDSKLSQNQTQSCGSCHIQALAFTDGLSRGIGSTGEVHPRATMSLANVVYFSRLTWNHPTLSVLETQAITPMFGTTPIEMGLSGDSYLDRLKANTNYVTLFQNAFGPDSITSSNVRKAISSFQRTFISGSSAFDYFRYRNDPSKMSASAKRGLNIFNGETAECFHCHGGFLFTDSVTHGNITNPEVIFHDNGLKSTTEYSLLSDSQKGLYEFTKQNTDIGKFRAPSLRNIALTYPYMHDGSIDCDVSLKPSTKVYSEECAKNALGKVIDHYISGGKSPSNKNSTFIRPFSLTSTEREDLIQFLLSLTDQELLTKQSLSNPF